jgi:MoaA/NifB/PqqE/SkfB family radical SAM enzyme
MDKTPIMTNSKYTGHSDRGLLNVGWICNLRCTHCFFHETPKKWKPFYRILLHLLLIRICGMRKVDITGGEPTLYPRLMLLLRVCRVLGFTETRINTNGTQNCDDLAKIKGVVFQTSSHSPNREDLVKFMGADVLDKVTAFHQKHKDQISYTNVCINQYSTDIPNLLWKIQSISGVKHFNLKSIDYEHDHAEQYPEHRHMAEINESIRRLFWGCPDATLDTTCFPFCLFDENVRGNVRYGTDPVVSKLNPNHQNPFISKTTPKWWYIPYILGINRREYEARAIKNNYHDGQIVRTEKCKGCICVQCPGIKVTYLKRFGDAELKPITKCPVTEKGHCCG